MNKNSDYGEQRALVLNQDYQMQTYYLKPAVVGVLGTLAAKYTLMPQTYVEIMGRRVNVWLASFAALYGASALAEVANGYLLPYLSSSEKFDSAKGIVPPVAAGAATVGVWDLLNSDAVAEVGVGRLAALGAAAEVAGSYLFERVISPLTVSQS